MWSPAAKVTVAEYAERWLSEQGSTLRARTLANYRRIFERDLIPEFGHTPLAALSRAQIKTYMARRAAGGAKANTVRNAIAPLRAMLSSALEDGLVRENVALRLPRVGRPRRRSRCRPAEQVDAVIAAAAWPRTARSCSPLPPACAAARCSRCAGPTSTSTTA